MTTLIERGILASIGLISITRDKAKEIVDELVKEGDVRREDAKQLMDRLVKTGEEERSALSKLVSEEVKKVTGNLQLATKKDIEALEKKIDKLAKAKE